MALIIYMFHVPMVFLKKKMIFMPICSYFPQNVKMFGYRELIAYPIYVPKILTILEIQKPIESNKSPPQSQPTANKAKTYRMNS